MSKREKIFISYRRADTEGYAGRLADSLTAYFGEDRVFRDVGGITPGEDFVQKIDESVAKASVVLVLIGPRWLSPEGDNGPRLHDADDHVAAEIAAALEQKRLVIPVLVQGARMPLEEDLPQRMRDLVRRNAVSVGDESWKSDVTRLANVLSFDVSGSVAERRLYVLQLIVLSLLAAPMVFSLIMFARDLGGTEAADELFRQALGSVNVVAVATVFVLLAGTASWFHPTKRLFVWAAVVTGFAGCLGTFVYYLITNDDTSRTEYIAFTDTSIIITVMLVLVCLSGFKPSERLR